MSSDVPVVEEQNILILHRNRAVNMKFKKCGTIGEKNVEFDFDASPRVFVIPEFSIFW